MKGLVRLTVVGDESTAEVVCGLLRADGIRCLHRATDLTAELPGPNAWREILVLGEALPRARELVDAVGPAADECSRCGRPLREDGSFHPDHSGTLQPYCAVCTERVFGPV